MLATPRPPDRGARGERREQRALPTPGSPHSTATRAAPRGGGAFGGQPRDLAFAAHDDPGLHALGERPRRRRMDALELAPHLVRVARALVDLGREHAQDEPHQRAGAPASSSGRAGGGPARWRRSAGDAPSSPNGDTPTASA
jgi:hypothetical protein